MTDEHAGEDEKAGQAGREGRAAAIIGVLGAGTMGAGIAQLACRSGAQTLLFDPIPEALEQRREKVAGTACTRKPRAGALSAEQAGAAAERLHAGRRTSARCAPASS